MSCVHCPLLRVFPNPGRHIVQRRWFINARWRSIKVQVRGEVKSSLRINCLGEGRGGAGGPSRHYTETLSGTGSTVTTVKPSLSRSLSSSPTGIVSIRITVVVVPRTIEVRPNFRYFNYRRFDKDETRWEMGEMWNSESVPGNLSLSLVF